MRGLSQVESGKDRKTFIHDAGMGSVSFLSILAGTLVAFASFAVLLAIVGAILAAVGLDTATLTANDYERLGIGGAVVAALVLFLSYFFGGYIAGRLARRAGALNGGLVLVLAILIGAVVAVLVGTQTDTESVAADLRVLGVPTSGSDYGAIATVAGVVTLLAMIAGAVLGGLKGERWHGKLAARALRPDVGPAAAAYQVADQEQAQADQRRQERERQEREREAERARRPWDKSPDQPVGADDDDDQDDYDDQPEPEPAPARSFEGSDDSTDVAPRPRRERPLRSGRRG